MPLFPDVLLLLLLEELGVSSSGQGAGVELVVGATGRSIVAHTN